MDSNTVQVSTPCIKNADIFETWLDSDRTRKFENVCERNQKLLGLEERMEELDKQIKEVAKFYCLKVKQKWEQCCRRLDRFMSANETWLNSNLNLPKALHDCCNLNMPSTSKGRPRKSFETCTDRTKKRRVQELVSQTSPEELEYAAKLTGRASGSPRKNDKTLTLQQTLALYLDLGLSKRKYSLLRSVVNSLHKDCFPSYYKLQTYKSEILPEVAVVSESTADVNLQSLLNKTSKSILNIVKENEEAYENTSQSFNLVCKWGFDGSSGHSNYKQTFENSRTDTDSFLFVTALVPLKLLDSVDEKEIWVNSRPGSILFCRPIKLIFAKENSALVRSEQSKLEKAISELESYETSIGNKNISVSFKMFLTMLDGSAINALSGANAAQNCYICGAKPSQMNLSSIAERAPNVQNYKYGLSSLHSWIRCFECLLHIAYRLPIQTWAVRGQENKLIFDERKKQIQENFREKMGLLVDIPKPGYGTTNDGNTARRFFSNPRLSSEITGVDKDLIFNFGIILRTIASGRQINMDNFVKLLEETKTIYLTKYSWYYMPSSVHKLLIHGKGIISFFELPIGVLSEEALEASHKEIRKARLDHTRKTMRNHTMSDLINHLLIPSDPQLSHLRSKNCHMSNYDQDICPYLLTDETNLSFPVELNPENLNYTSETDTEL